MEDHIRSPEMRLGQVTPLLQESVGPKLGSQGPYSPNSLVLVSTVLTSEIQLQVRG